MMVLQRLLTFFTVLGIGIVMSACTTGSTSASLFSTPSPLESPSCTPLQGATGSAEALFDQGVDFVWKKLLEVLKQRHETVSFSDQATGQLQTQLVWVSSERRAQIVAGWQGLSSTGAFYQFYFILTPEAENRTRVHVQAFISESDLQASPEVLPSNGTLEREVLEDLSRAVCTI